jgi:hypothetical protein
MKNITSLGALMLAFAIPAVSFAATYLYINVQGTLGTVTADTAAQAIVTPSDIDPHSGVMLVASTVSTVSTASPVQIAAATTLKQALRVALSAHVTTSVAVLRDISSGSSTATDFAAQDANAVGISQAITSIYGQAAASTFLQIFRTHIVDSNAYTMNLKNGNTAGQAAALASLDSQLVQLSNFFSSSNPNIDNATLLAALRQHEQLVNHASVTFANKDVAGSRVAEEQAVLQIQSAADYLSGAIFKQFPAIYGPQ